jgi:O-methyltransferase involved in polyketide biosynthesis
MVRHSGAVSSARISPTAHYTGYVWFKHGLGDPALVTRAGRLMHAALSPANAVSRALFGPSIDGPLLARHRVIDHLLEQAIAAGEVDQVLEIAAGLSPRGLRLVRRHPALRYVEADLPAMAARKRQALDVAGAGGDHRVVELDALVDDGPRSLAAVCDRELRPGGGLAIVTEGLLNYFDRAAVEGMWRRFAAELGRRPRGLYLSDLHLADEIARVPLARLFGHLLSGFARGAVHFHYRDAAAVEAALVAAGFARATAHLAGDHPAAGVRPRDSAYVRVIEARTWTRS